MSATPRVVMVTGAAGNLGQAVALTFAAQGARLLLVDRERDALASAFASDFMGGGNHLLFAADLLDRDDTARAVAEAVAKAGRIDALCHLVGGFRMGDPVHTTADADWDFLFDVNVRTLRQAARAVVPQMLSQGGGRIVAVGAASAQRGQAQMGAYLAAKSAVARLVESMSAELREQGIRVNAVLPSIIDTPQNRADMPDAEPSRWVAPQALADVIAFLCSDAARAVHGATVPVCGLS